MQRQPIDSEGQVPQAGINALIPSGQEAKTPQTKLADNDTEFFTRLSFQESPKKGCELLFRRYHQALCSHAVRYVYSKETAEDIVSEVFCKFWKTKAYENMSSSYRFTCFSAFATKPIITCA